ncbi:CAP domain-containing protein [Cytobacillus oceanisediminis]|uniref:CAP domain-containing protein n=1 Tax=Cytobacillus oceanisediminis TaxID=665099 RepID=UPI00207A54F2|nr:CAP domain-containing protein [Cytobacillus oceanisediminis]USK46018.1 CAP domain-containing protein [Cytobacillus oceanisediminis]
MRKFKTIIIFFFLIFFTADHAGAATDYRVEQKDTLWEIALRFQQDLQEIINSNPQIENPDLIFPGEIIIIPGDGREIAIPKMDVNEIELIKLANQKRKELRLKPLSADLHLNGAAKKKSLDMMKLEYVSHNSPTYGNPIEMLRNQRISFLTVKENIGAGYKTADEMFAAWMNSSVHQENILSKKATHIGVGYIQGGLHGHYWTIFIVEKKQGG